MSRCLFLRCLHDRVFERTAQTSNAKTFRPLVFTLLGRKNVSSTCGRVLSNEWHHRRKRRELAGQYICGLRNNVYELSRHHFLPGMSFHCTTYNESSAHNFEQEHTSIKHHETSKRPNVRNETALKKNTSVVETSQRQQQERSAIGRTTSRTRSSSSDLRRSFTILPLGQDFEKHFLRLIRLHHQYPQDLESRKKYFRFKNYFERPDLRNLSGDGLRAWIHGRKLRQVHSILMHLLLGSLTVSARQTLFVLSNLGPFRDNFRNRLRCLRYIFWAYREELTSDEALLAEFDEHVAELRISNDWPKTPMNEAQVRLILQRSNKAGREAFIKRYFVTYGAPGPQAIAEFARSYVRSEEIEKAAEIMGKMTEPELQNPDKVTSAVCEQILWHDTIIQTESGPNFKYLPNLLERGFRPSPFLHSRIIEIALGAGYPNVAWDMYHFLSSSGVAIHPWTYSLLLRQSFLNRDIPHLNEMMSLIHNKEELYTDRYILAYSMNMVRVISYYERGCSTNEALAHILALYDRAYNRNTLVKLRVVPHESQEEHVSVLPDPSPAMLGFTIWSYILCHRRASYLQRLWNWIRHLAEQGEDKILQALEHDVIYNGFILFYTRRPETLLHALNVVQYMLEKKYCLPTARTWSTLVCGFLKHGQLEQAQRIVGMMQKHGFSYIDVGEKHVPSGFKLEDLRSRQEEILDELSLPEGLDFGPSSLPSSLELNKARASAAKPNSSLWDGIVDLRFREKSASQSVNKSEPPLV